MLFIFRKTTFCFRLEPQLKQLQVKYDELKERKSSFKNAAYFLSNLKQLHQDYSDTCEREQNVKETVSSIFMKIQGHCMLSTRSSEEREM